MQIRSRQYCHDCTDLATWLVLCYIKLNGSRSGSSSTEPDHSTTRPGSLPASRTAPRLHIMTGLAPLQQFELEIPSCKTHVMEGWGLCKEGFWAAHTPPAPAFHDADFADEVAVLQVHRGNKISIWWCNVEEVRRISLKTSRHYIDYENTISTDILEWCYKGARAGQGPGRHQAAQLQLPGALGQAEAAHLTGPLVQRSSCSAVRYSHWVTKVLEPGVLAGWPRAGVWLRAKWHAAAGRSFISLG